MKKVTVLITVAILVLCLGSVAGAFTISDDATGGDCTQIGTWDAGTKTCKLAQDVYVADSTDICEIPLFWYAYWPCAINITDDGITLDGNGHTVYGTSTNGGNVGVVFNGLSNITIKNLTATGSWSAIFAGFSNNIQVKDCSLNNDSYALYLRSTQYASITGSSFSGNIAAIISNWGNGNYTIEGNAFSANQYGISLDATSPNVVITGNTFSSSGYSIILSADNTQVTNNLIEDGSWAIRIGGAAQNTIISNNDLSNNQYGMGVEATDTAQVSGNTVSGSVYGIIHEGSSGTMTLTNNTISDNIYGLHIAATSGHLIYHNNFINNYGDLSPWTTTGNTWSLDLPDGGNYWDRHDSPSEGCTDNNGNSICDQPYSFAAGTDYYPWTKPDGWSCQSAPAFEITSFSPESIWPPSNKNVDIAVSGQLIVPDGCTLSGASFTFTDEYGENSFYSALALASDGSFTLTIPVEASRNGSDLDGRTYSLVFSATDDAGTAQSEPLVATVLHDMRK